MVAHEAPVYAGLGAEIAARVTERCFYHLEAPVLRVGGFATPYPPSRLEDHYLPDLDRILDSVRPHLRLLRSDMTELKQFKLPDVGEGLTEAEIVTWHVKPGDQVEDGQVIVDIEAAKGVVELPSPWDGVVARLLAEEGQTVDVGAPIIAIEVGAVPTSPPHPVPPRTKQILPNEQVVPAAAPADQSAASDSQSGQPHGDQPHGDQPQSDQPQSDQPQRVAVLVGYGVKASATTRRARKLTAGRPETAEVPTLPATPTEPPPLPTQPTSQAATAAQTADAAQAERSRRARQPSGRWPSRRCASWPRTWASASPS